MTEPAGHLSKLGARREMFAYQVLDSERGKSGIQGTEARQATQTRVTAVNLEPNTPAFYSFWLKASSSIFAAGQQAEPEDRSPESADHTLENEPRCAANRALFPCFRRSCLPNNSH
jgi:hypothetical protein